MEVLLNLEGAQRLVNNMAAANDERYQPRIVPITTATAAGTAAKVATLAGYTPQVNDLIALTFTPGNTANSPTLNINGGGAIQIRTAAGQPTGAAGTGGINAAANGTVLLVVGMEGANMRYWLAGSQDITDAQPVTSVAGRTGAVTLTATDVGLANVANHASPPNNRTISTTAPLAGGGDLSSNRTLTINAAGAATATGNGTAGSAVYAADNNTTARNMAATPAGVAAQVAAATAGIVGDLRYRGMVTAAPTPLSAPENQTSNYWVAQSQFTMTPTGGAATTVNPTDWIMQPAGTMNLQIIASPLPTPGQIGAAPASHQHSGADINSGSVAVNRGGTGRTANWAAGNIPYATAAATTGVIAAPTANVAQALVHIAATVAGLPVWRNLTGATSLRNDLGLGTGTGMLTAADIGIRAMTNAEVDALFGL